MTVEAHIVDVEFSHAQGMCASYQPGPIRWRRDRAGRVPVRFFTDRSLDFIADYEADTKVALLIEPPIGGNLDYYDAAVRLPFDWVLTYSREMVDRCARALPYHFGGSWIRRDEFWSGQSKDALVSIITSPKHDSQGQRLRHEIAAAFPSVERFGSDFRYVESKATALRPFAFSIVVENSSIDDYFSEKLIDCMLCGAVPIYWGSPAIANTFNPEGMLTFRSVADLRAVLQTLSINRWWEMYRAVCDNRQRAERFLSPEYGLAARYPFLFPAE